MSYSLPDFLAHAIALEKEAADRYAELAEIMEDLGNRDVASIFRDMSRFSQKHAKDVEARVGSADMPQLKSWEYRWQTPPESGGDKGISFIMTPLNALDYAHANEVRGMNYYRSAAAESEDAEVRRLGGDFAAEEAAHAATLEQWIVKERSRIKLVHHGSSDGGL